MAVGRAIVRKPKVFLFDEPLSNLDAKMRVQMRAEISKLHKKLQATIIYVTHDQVEAMTMGSRIVVMKSGVIQQVAAPLDLYHKPKNRFVAGFIGSPPMNFFDGRIRTEGREVIFDEGVFSVTLPEAQASALRTYAGKDVVFGVRPADVHHLKRAPEAARAHRVDARVEVVEPMGDEIYIYLDTGKHSFIARSSDLYDVKIGEEFSACFNMAKTHFFDKETEVAIC